MTAYFFQASDLDGRATTEVESVRRVRAGLKKFPEVNEERLPNAWSTLGLKLLNGRVENGRVVWTADLDTGLSKSKRPGRSMVVVGVVVLVVLVRWFLVARYILSSLALGEGGRTVPKFRGSRTPLGICLTSSNILLPGWGCRPSPLQAN